MPIDHKAWAHHQSRAADLLAQRAAAWPERPPELVAASRDHLGALARMLVTEAESAGTRDSIPFATDLLDADNAIFICGTMKSGTSLLLELFDDHPELCAMPGDTSLWKSLEHPESMSIAGVLDHWVQRIMNPTGLPPFFPLGPDSEPYERFARVTRSAMDHRIASLAGGAGIADALNQSAIPKPVRRRRFVEKTPDNELHLDSILRAFPAARFIHIARDPEPTLRSLIKLHQVRGWDYRDEWLRGYIEKSADVANANRDRLGPDRYMVIRYEELTSDVDRAMRGITDWVDIEWDDSLRTPTVLGVPATSNSMWKERQVVGHVVAAT